MAKGFRFGVVAGGSSGEEWMDKARRIEDLGFDTLLVPDTMRYTLAPFPALAAAAAATSSLRVGTYVLANDYRNPVMVAKDAATLDLLSGGRFDLGVGAGRPEAAGDNAMLGLPFESGGVRVSRLTASLSIIKGLLNGREITAAGEYYTVTNATIAPRPVQSPLPILLAAGHRRLVEIAAREADIVALAVPPNETEEEFEKRINLLRAAAGERFERLAINVSLMAVAGRVPEFVRRSWGDEMASRMAESDAVPVLYGTTDAMCDRLTNLRDRYGVNYLTVSEELLDAFAPVVARLAQT
jgi:probable F420-dependent oxidoreductase